MSKKVAPRASGSSARAQELADVTGHTHAISNPELDDLCASARQVHELCQLFGIEFRGYRPLMGLLQGADKAGVSLQELVEDPDQRPYIWDLKE